MSWGSYRAGNGEEVVKASDGDMNVAKAHNPQIEKLVTKVQGVIDEFVNLAGNDRIFVVKNSGHVDQYSGSLSLTIEVYQKV